MKKLIIKTIGVLFCVFALFTYSVYGQSRKNKTGTDTTSRNNNRLKPDSIVSQGPRPYAKVITADAKTCRGVFTIHKVKDRYYFELPDSLIDRVFLVRAQIAQSPALLSRSFFGFAGDQLGEMQISFSKGPNDKLFFRNLYFNEQAADTSVNGLSRSLANNDVQPIIAAFDIKAYGKDSSAVIDVTDYISGDHELMTGAIKNILKFQALQQDRSWIEAIHAFPQNVDIEAVKTYSSGPGADNQHTLKLNTSFLLLPKRPMKKRYADERVGFSTYTITDLDADPQSAQKVAVSLRWRLAPKLEDLEKYKRGELVEPAKPIIFYIDPATPAKWVPYLIEAVDDWNVAFEQAGFKHAIIGKRSPVNDSAFSMEDARNNTIVYAPSLATMSGSSITYDDRSGEILHAEVHIDHNIIVTLHDQYMIEAGAIDSNARKMIYKDSLMGELLRGICSKEIGHTLGLVDNFGASSTVKVDSLRNRRWLQKYGHSPSIMDAAMFDYVAQPDDHIAPKEILPHIGLYDKWAIKWGYQLFPDISDPREERDHLQQITTRELAVNPYLFFGKENKDYVLDPRNQADDLGDDAVAASNLAIKNLHFVASHLAAWSMQKNELWSTDGNKSLNRLAYAVLEQFTTYMVHAANNLGTINYSPGVRDSKKAVYRPVPMTKQKQAMQFLTAELFKTAPDWIITTETADKSLILPYDNVIYLPGINVLVNNLLSVQRLKNINAIANRYGNGDVYALDSYLDDLDNAIWPELLSGKRVSNYHRVLQKNYLLALEKVFDTKREATTTNMIAVTRGHLLQLKVKIKLILPRIKDLTTKSHYLDVLAQINELTDPHRTPMISPGIQVGKPLSTLNSWGGEPIRVLLYGILQFDNTL